MGRVSRTTPSLSTRNDSQSFGGGRKYKRTTRTSFSQHVPQMNPNDPAELPSPPRWARNSQKATWRAGAAATDS